MESHQRVFDRDPAILAELTQSAGNCLPCGACHRCHLLVREQEREAKAAVFEFLSDLMREFKKQAAQARGHGLSQGDAAGVLKRKAVFLADALNRSHLGLLVAAQEVHEPVSFDRPQLSSCKGFGGNLVYAVG